MPLKAVLFDYDGVTAATPRMNYAAWKHVFAQAGAQIGEREYYLLEGHGPKKVAAALCRAHGIDQAKGDDLSRAKESYMQNLGAIQIYGEIPGLLDFLKSAGLALGLVTGGARTRIENSLPPTIRPYFDAIVTSDDVLNTKPDPEPYLKVANVLGILPREALAVENAPLGIRSAKTAGMVCCAILTTLKKSDLAEADAIFESHSGLEKYLKNPKTLYQNNSNDFFKDS